MLVVKVVRKYYNEKGELIGYVIQDESGATKAVRKEALKQAIVSRQVEVINMTMTSDGRLIGSVSKEQRMTQHALRATPQQLAQQQAKAQQAKTVQKPIQKPVQHVVTQQPVKIEPKTTSQKQLIEVYTNGKRTVGVMENNNSNEKLSDKMNAGDKVVSGITFLNSIKNNEYANARMENGKLVGEFKKKQFKKVKAKLLTIIDTVVEDKTKAFDVKKVDKGVYAIAFMQSNVNENIFDIAMTMLEDSMADYMVRPVSRDGVTITVQANNIDDVRKAAKYALVIK